MSMLIKRTTLHTLLQLTDFVQLLDDILSLFSLHKLRKKRVIQSTYITRPLGRCDLLLSRK